MTNGAHVSGKPLCLCAHKQPTSDEGFRDRHRVGFPRQTHSGEKHSSRSKYIFYRTWAPRWTWEENFFINKALSWVVLSVELELNHSIILQKWMNKDILYNSFQMYSGLTNLGRQTHILPLWQHSTPHPVTRCLTFDIVTFFLLLTHLQSPKSRSHVSGLSVLRQKLKLWPIRFKLAVNFKGMSPFSTSSPFSPITSGHGALSVLFPTHTWCTLQAAGGKIKTLALTCAAISNH